MIYVEDELREGSSRSGSLPNYGVNIDRSAHRTGPVVAMPSFGQRGRYILSRTNPPPVGAGDYALTRNTLFRVGRLYLSS